MCQIQLGEYLGLASGKNKMTYKVFKGPWLSMGMMQNNIQYSMFCEQVTCAIGLGGDHDQHDKERNGLRGS